jgi:putative transposase
MTTYPTNVSDSQWQIIAKYLDTERNRKYDLREIVTAILYLVKAGCQWRMLPGDFAPWKTVYYYFSVWKKQEVFEVIHETLVEQVRVRQGRKQEPTVGIMDAQSVKNTLVSCENKGFDAAKKVKGIRRHIIVDTLGLVLVVVIQSACVQDRNGALSVVEKLVESWRKITKIFADGGYSGKLIERVKSRFNIELGIVKREQSSTFKVLPKRWIVERTFAWIDTNRRNAKYYERLNDTGAAMRHLSAIRIMLNRF